MPFLNKVTSPFRKTNVISWLPLILVEVWISITLIICRFGPWDYHIPKPGLFWFYMIVYLIFLAVGYSIFTIKSYSTLQYQNLDLKQLGLKYIWFPLIIYFISFFPLYGLMTAGNGGSPADFINNLLLGITDPKAAYYLKISASTQNAQPAIIQVLLTGILAPFIWFIVPLTIYYWNKVSKLYKIAFSIYLFLEIGKWMSVGTNKGLFDLLAVFTVSLFADICMNFKDYGFKTLKMKLSLIIMVVCFFVLSMSYYGYTITERVSSVSTLMASNDKMSGLTQRQLEKPLLVERKNNGEPNAIKEEKHGTALFVENIYLGFTCYLTQGYYSMGQALLKDYSSTYGIGNSYFLMRVYEIFTGDNLIDHTYPGKLLPEIDPYIRWHTAFVWWASDISFPGVAIYMFILGAAFAWFWRDAVIKHNIISYSMLSLFGIMFFYISCNNQVFAFPATFCAFWGIVIFRILFYLYGRKNNRTCELSGGN